MTEGYTPSFDRVRDLYSWAYAWRTEDGEDDTDLSGLRKSNRAEFDRAVAEHDAEVLEVLANRLLGDEAVLEAARELAGLEPGESWPTNDELGGNLTGTRDDEYRAGLMDHAHSILAAALAAVTEERRDG